MTAVITGLQMSDMDDMHIYTCNLMFKYSCMIYTMTQNVISSNELDLLPLSNHVLPQVMYTLSIKCKQIICSNKNYICGIKKMGGTI